ncbi:hypothetical protein CspeluHIS016_0101230 [Cutaneotrichosporon spelunceum]|uniref:Cytochrome b5 heme-binding domain-containing protein n=1 Tax=Cutaneotrichosporon spelunceum TaxID=1672016 RepID=A0AAD3TMZ0_9TREE|nr:hypothetical protein CspeluHIS016_0101230 [Cutaneotrichosporon spelunceum]
MSDDVYTDHPSHTVPGVRERSRPGTGGEPVYESVKDINGRRVSGKPTNRAILADQRARAERARKRAERERMGPAPPSSWSSVLGRLLLFALFLPALSHFLTGTYHFGLEDSVRLHVRRVWRHPANPFRGEGREFTLRQLAEFDGADDRKPVYLSIGGTVYDVSSNRRIYGRGGSYNMMAGRDASRAFVTGCFETHLTHDLRGLSQDELKALQGWKDFFENHARYWPVGRTILPPISANTPIPPPCREHVDNAPGASHRGRPRPDPVAKAGKRKDTHTH